MNALKEPRYSPNAMEVDCFYLMLEAIGKRYQYVIEAVLCLYV
jgi:hypothetical protein